MPPAKRNATGDRGSADRVVAGGWRSSQANDAGEPRSAAVSDRREGALGVSSATAEGQCDFRNDPAGSKPPRTVNPRLCCWPGTSSLRVAVLVLWSAGSRRPRAARHRAVRVGWRVHVRPRCAVGCFINDDVSATFSSSARVMSTPGSVRARDHAQLRAPQDRLPPFYTRVKDVREDLGKPLDRSSRQFDEGPIRRPTSRCTARGGGEVGECCARRAARSKRDAALLIGLALSSARSGEANDPVGTARHFVGRSTSDGSASERELRAVPANAQRHACRSAVSWLSTGRVLVWVRAGEDRRAADRARREAAPRRSGAHDDVQDVPRRLRPATPTPATWSCRTASGS